MSILKEPKESKGKKRRDEKISLYRRDLKKLGWSKKMINEFFEGND